MAVPSSGLGSPGDNPFGPVQVIYPIPGPAKPGIEGTKGGADMDGAYDTFRQALKSKLPSLRHQFQTLAHKPIGR